MYRTVLKFLDELVLPVLVLISARYISIFITSSWLSAQYVFNWDSTDYLSLPFISFPDSMEGLLLNSLSWLFVVFVISVYLGLILFRAFYFHEALLHPTQAQRIHRKNLQFLVIDSREANYHLFVWLALILLISGLIAGDFLQGRVSSVAFGYLSTNLIVFTILAAIFLLRSKQLANRG